MSGVRLLRYASMLVDAAAVMVLCALIQAMGGAAWSGGVILAVLVIVVGLLYMALTDFALKGRSLGKVLFGFHPVTGEDFDGRARFSARLLGFADAVSPDETRAFRHDGHGGVRFQSSVVHIVVDWMIEVHRPGRVPRVYQLSLFGRFRESGYIRIGRDTLWTDITLPQGARRISRKHMVLYSRGTRLLAMNYAARHGLDIDGCPLAQAKQKAELGHGAVIALPGGGRPQIIIRVMRSTGA